MRAGRSSSSSIKLLLALGCSLALTADGDAAERIDRCQRNMACRFLSDKGVALSEQKRYAEALKEFQSAYEAEPAPRLLLNIGRSLYRLGRSAEAIDYYARYRKVVISLDSETEQVVKRYELDALLVMSAGEQPEPAPAPLSLAFDRRPPKTALVLLGTGVGLLVIGIGLGAGAISAGKSVSQPGNNFMTFGPTEQAIETRGLNLQASGIAFDVFGLLALGTGAASLGTWLYLKKAVQNTQAYSP